MAYALASTYEDMGRVTIEPEQGAEVQQFLFRTRFSRRGPFRYEFRGETHPELILIRSDGRITGYFWSAEEEELQVAGPYEALLRAGPPTSGIARWVPLLLLSNDDAAGLSLLDAQTARYVRTSRTSEGQSVHELILDAGTPMERTVWIDGKSYLILQIEMKRTTAAGNALIRAAYQPQVDQPIPWDSFTEGAMPLQGDDGLVEVRPVDQLTAIPGPDDVLAVVFGSPIRMDDLYPDGQPAAEVVQAELGLLLGQIVFGDVMETVVEARNYDTPQAMVDSYIAYRINSLKQRLSQIDEALASDTGMEPARRQQLQAIRNRTRDMLSMDTAELETSFAQEAVEMVRLWQFNRDVYTRYGGRVIHSETGPEPIEAYRDLVREQIEQGRVELRIAELADLFWSVFDPPVAYEIPSEQVTFERPWWMHGTISMPR